MDNTETLTEVGTQDTEKTEGEGTIRNGQPRDTGRIWYTRHRENRRGRDNQEWTTQRHWQNLVHKTQRKPKGKGQSGMDNPETLAEFGTQDTEKTEGEGTIRNGQHRYTGRI